MIEGPAGLLLVRRPDDDRVWPGLWGLPAASLREGESEREAVLRVGRDKLGVTVDPLRPMREDKADRRDYRIAMRDWAASIVGGRAGGSPRRRGHAVRGLAMGDAGGAGARGAGRLGLRPRAAALPRLFGGEQRSPASWRAGPGIPAGEARWLSDGFRGAGRGRGGRRMRPSPGLRERGSPAHDGMATRLAGWRTEDEPARARPSAGALGAAAARPGEACDSLTALCVVRRADGRWLAGGRAGWVSTWANRWALGAGGAVDRLGESPAETLSRELERGVAAQSPTDWLLRHCWGCRTASRCWSGWEQVPDAADPVPGVGHDEWAWWPDRPPTSGRRRPMRA